MGSLFVVTLAPVFAHATHLFERVKDVAIEHFGSVGTIEAFDKGVLCRLAGLYEFQADAMLLGPAQQRLTDQFRPIVQANFFWFTTQFDQLLKGAYRRGPVC